MKRKFDMTLSHSGSRPRCHPSLSENPGNQPSDRWPCRRSAGPHRRAHGRHVSPPRRRQDAGSGRHSHCSGSVDRLMEVKDELTDGTEGTNDASDPDDRDESEQIPAKPQHHLFATAAELTFHGRTVKVEQGLSGQPGREFFDTPSHSIAVCVLGGGADRPEFPAGLFPQLQPQMLWVAQARLNKETPECVADFLETTASAADIRYLFLSMAPGTGPEQAATRRRAYEVCNRLPQWRRAVVFHNHAPQGSKSIWRSLMVPWGFGPAWR